MKENIKFVASTTAPNPKETDYWIDLSASPTGGIIKKWNGNAWEDINEYLHVFMNKIQSQIASLRIDTIKLLNFKNSTQDIIDDIGKRLTELEKHHPEVDV